MSINKPYNEERLKIYCILSPRNMLYYGKLVFFIQIHMQDIRKALEHVDVFGMD